MLPTRIRRRNASIVADTGVRCLHEGVLTEPIDTRVVPRPHLIAAEVEVRDIADI